MNKKSTDSFVFNYDLFKQFKLQKLLKVLKIKDCCVELFYVNKKNLECITSLEYYKMDYLAIKLNKFQTKLVININANNILYLEKIFSTFDFEEMNLWDKNVMLKNNLEMQLNSTKLYLNYKEENNEVELVYDKQKYDNLNKLYLQNNLMFNNNII